MTQSNLLKSVTLKATKVFLLSLITVTLISCGSSKPMVNNVNVTTTVEDNDVFLSLTADLGIGNLQLPTASLPIILPKDGREIGQVSLVGSLGGKNILSIDINVSEAAHLELASVKLPNGSMIPLIADNPVLQVPVKNVIVYLSLVEGAQVLSVTVPIKSFDSLGRKVGTATLMPIFSKNGTIGAAGIYTSKTTGQNGISVVADISGKLETVPAFSGIQLGAGQLAAVDGSRGALSAVSSRSFKSASFAPQDVKPSLDFSSKAPSKRIKRRIDKELYKLHRKRKKLRMY